MLQRETVLESTLDLLRKMQSMPGLSGLRLVGGTALAIVDTYVKTLHRFVRKGK